MFTCPRGGLIYTSGETGEVLFLLKRGLVQLYQLSPGGKKLVVGTLAPGAFFGEMPLLGQSMADTYAEAARACLICAMGQGDVEALLLAEPRVALQTLAAMGGRLNEQRALLSDVVFKSVPAGQRKDDTHAASPLDGYRRRGSGHGGAQRGDLRRHGDPWPPVE